MRICRIIPLRFNLGIFMCCELLEQRKAAGQGRVTARATPRTPKARAAPLGTGPNGSLAALVALVSDSEQPDLELDRYDWIFQYIAGE